MVKHRVKPKKTTSLVWNYFDDVFDGAHVFCVICAESGKDTKYKIGDGETSQIRSHVQNVHKAQWLDMKNLEKAREADKQKSKKRRVTDDMNMKQPTMFNIVKKMTMVDPLGATQQKYDQLLLELIGSNFLSFNMVNSPEFHSFVRNLDKTINLKSSRTYSKQMNKYCKEILEDVQKIVKDNCDASMSITTDLYTSRTLDSYISLTTHFIDKNFKMNSYQHHFNQ